MKTPIDRLISAIPDSEKESGRRVNRPVRIGWIHTREEYRIITMAARSLDISITSFCRRAVMSFAAHTLGIDYYDVMRGAPAALTFQQHPREHKGKTYMNRRVIEGSEDGKGVGKWRISSLE